MPYFSKLWQVEVRNEIAAEFICPDGSVDDNLAGLHEIRARAAERRHATSTDETATPGTIYDALEADGWKVLRRRKNQPAA